jgi:hypothetical protein
VSRRLLEEWVFWVMAVVAAMLVLYLALGWWWPIH